MAEELVIPDYQVTLTHEKQRLGISLTADEQQLIETRAGGALNEYFVYLQKVYPDRYESTVRSAALTPIRNYRDNYKASQLLIKAYFGGYFNSCTATPELSAFKSKYRQYYLLDNFRFFGGVSAMIAFNVILGVPKMRTVSGLIFQNAALALGWYTGITPAVESLRKEMLPYLDIAAQQNKSELFRLHSEHKLIYQYPHVLEDFPPDEFNDTNREFLISKGIYEHAHRNDFNGTNRNKSQYVVFKETSDRLVNQV